MTINPSDSSDQQYDLHCAHCKSTFTHHVAVDIFSRSREDADSVSYRVYDKPFQIYDSQTMLPNGPTPPIGANPSSRRDGVAIVYCCENCGLHSRLTIEQHKGQTYLDTSPC